MSHHIPRFEDRYRHTPHSYASHLATYIASPTKIEGLTVVAFGRAPPLHTIAQLRFAVEQADKRLKNLERLRGLHDEPDEEDCDEIVIAPPPEPIVLAPEPPADNPFIGRYSTARRLIATVAADHDRAPAEITGHGRSAYLIDPRALVAHFLRKRGYSYPEIGRAIGGRDHSTAINLVRKFDICCRRNPETAQSYHRHLALLAEADALLESEAA